MASFTAIREEEHCGDEGGGECELSGKSSQDVAMGWKRRPEVGKVPHSSEHRRAPEERSRGLSDQVGRDFPPSDPTTEGERQRDHWVEVGAREMYEQEDGHQDREKPG
jgi:hypothetical protein